MSLEHSIGDSQELAALYLAGAMTPSETSAFESHLAHGCARCDEELRGLGGVLDNLVGAPACIEPDPDIKRRLLARIDEPHRANSDASAAASSDQSPQVWRRWAPDGGGLDHVIRRGSDNDWEATGINGIDVRRLFVDPARNQMTMLVRMAAGTAYPRHIHDGPEECLVLEGDLRVGDDVLRKGDYQRMASGSRHPVQSTDGGCLLMIVSSLTDELE